ncbi:MAG: phosphoenolpyruvate-protein phosphotransferase system enzyme [Actinomycetota bacterium]|nr:phosphoenolpyruvate-protein phosphotransferase system enzyme [Actinomycetota bacterium]
MPEPLRGLGVSPGVGAGPVFRVAAPPALPEQQPTVDDAAGEARRATEALEQVGAELEARAATATATAAEVLGAQAMIARDPTLAETVAGKVLDGVAAAWAVDAALREQQDVFLSLGGYMAERAADLDDIRARTVALLLGQPMPGVPSPGEPFVLVADDLAPADTAQLEPASVRALVTERGGPTSHTAILAKALGIPAVVSCRGALGLAEGSHVSVDGTTGVVTLVEAAEVAAIQQAADAERRALAETSGPGQTSDGHPVKLLLNVGSAKDLAGVDPDGFEGVGLVRSEFLYLGRTEAPSGEEQEAAYTELFEAMGGRKVVLRTLDAGADKPLPFLGLAAEENPALGVRGLRVSRVQPEVLADQLGAVARAAKSTEADIYVMAPMVSTVAEAAAFADQVHGLGLPMAGVMVEVPAAALQARRLLEVVDFLSIGTNDLSQYTLATDRMSGELADLLDPWQPAVLQLVAMCAEAGREVDKSVSVCGEAASDPLLALVYVGMGITSLSMSASSVPAVRVSIGRHTREECENLARIALEALDAESARAAVAARI